MPQHDSYIKQKHRTLSIKINLSFQNIKKKAPQNLKQITITALRRKLKGLYFSSNVKFVIKKAKDKIHNLYINRKS
jgi:hypothetical protein